MILTTTQTTSTTVLYTASTRHDSTTFTSRIFDALLILLRIITATSTLAILYLKLTLTYSFSSPFHLPSPHGFLSTIPPFLPSNLSLPHLYVLLPCTLFLLYLSILKTYSSESLLVIRGLGLQISSSGATYMTSPTTRFIPTTSIQDVFLHEIFVGFEVRYYLLVVVEGEEEFVVVFPVSTAPSTILSEK